MHRFPPVLTVAAVVAGLAVGYATRPQAASPANPATAAVPAAVAAAAAPSSTPPQAAAEFDVQRLSESLYLVTGEGGGNVAVLAGPDGIVLVDDHVTELSPQLLRAVARIQPGPVRFVLNTHWHFDHAGGNAALGGAGATIVAHDAARRRLVAGQVLDIGGRKMPIAPAPREALPVVTFADGLTLHLNGEEIRLVHVGPAHTDGDVLVYFRHANVVHTGDVFLNRLFPFIDRGSGGTIAGYGAIAERLIGEADANTRLIPGHGPLATRADVVAWRDMLRTAQQRVGALVRQGRSADQAVAAQPLREYAQGWGSEFLPAETFVRSLYAELAGPPR